MQIDWADFKIYVDDHSLNIQHIVVDNTYMMKAFNGPFEVSCQIPIQDPANSDQSAFEASYKADSNKDLDQLDSDGAHLTRAKTTKTGWHYEPRSLDFDTCKLGSLYNRKHDGNGIDDGTDYGDASLKFYNASGVELVQGGSETDADFQIRLTANCVKTDMLWQSTYNFDIIGGSLQVKNEPTDRAYVWCIIAPDIAENLGGSVPYFAGGINLCFFKAGMIQRFDGRGIKSFVYDPVYNSNKLQFSVKHKLGEQIGLQMILDQFRA